MNPDILTKGVYEEELKSGGSLIVTKTSWRIEYLFGGKDRRYLCRRRCIDGSQIDEYIAAWINNFERFCALKESLPDLSGEIKFVGEKNMIISVGGECSRFTEGVCLEIYYYYHQRIRDRTQLDKLIEDYEMAKNKARTIQEIFYAIK